MQIPSGFTGQAAALTREGVNAIPGPAEAAAPYAALGRGLEQAGGTLLERGTQIAYQHKQDMEEAQIATFNSDMAMAAATAMTELQTQTTPITDEQIKAVEDHLQATTDAAVVPKRYKALMAAKVKESMASVIPQVAKHNATLAATAAEATIDQNFRGALAAGDYATSRVQLAIAQESPYFTAVQKHEMLKSQVGSEATKAVEDAYAKGGPDAALSAADSVMDNSELPESELRTIRASLHKFAGSLDEGRKTAEKEFNKDRKAAHSEVVATLHNAAKFGEKQDDGSTAYLSVEDLDYLKSKMADSATPMKEAEYGRIRSAIEARERRQAKGDVSAQRMYSAVTTNDPGQALGDPHRTETARDAAAKYLPSFAQYDSFTPQNKALLMHMTAMGYDPPQMGNLLEAGIKSNNLALTHTALALANDLLVKAPNYYRALPASQMAFYSRAQNLEAGGALTAEALSEARDAVNRTPAELDDIRAQYKALKVKPEDNVKALKDAIEEDDSLGERSGELADALDDPEIGPTLRALNESLVRDSFGYTNDLASARKNAYSRLLNVARPTTINGYPQFMEHPPEWPPGASAPVDSATLRGMMSRDLRGYYQGEKETGTTTNELLVSPTPATVNGSRVYAISTRPKGSHVGGTPVYKKTGERLYYAFDYDEINARNDEHAKAQLEEYKANPPQIANPPRLH